MKEDRSTLLKISPIEDDGIFASPIKEHSLDKYRAISLFTNIFSTGMKHKWDTRVFIDLFSGPGKSKLKKTGSIYPGSPWISLTIKDHFNKYIFCELKPKKFEALKKRVQNFQSDKNVVLINGDVNTNITNILHEIPTGSSQNKVLSLCLVDPFNIGSLKFSTITSLNNGYMDFFVLIPSFMDVRRNQTRYFRPSDNSIDIFLGDKDWRSKWIREEQKGIKIGLFILDQFGQKMKSLGFIYGGPEKALTIFVTSKNVPLYHLYLFSKHSRGVQFWEETKKYFSDQLPLI